MELPHRGYYCPVALSYCGTLTFTEVVRPAELQMLFCDSTIHLLMSFWIHCLLLRRFFTISCFFLFVDNGSDCDSLESKCLINGFVAFFKLGATSLKMLDVGDFISHLFLNFLRMTDVCDLYSTSCQQVITNSFFDSWDTEVFTGFTNILQVIFYSE